MDPVALKQRLGEKLNVPSLPKVVLRINEMLANPELGMRDIGAEIAKDPPLTAKLLRTANSAYYGLRVQVLSPEHAAAILGQKALGNLVMQVALMELFPVRKGEHGITLFDFWRQSILTARLCSLFRPAAVQKHSAEELYLCGLLHDLGVFVMLDALGRELFELYADVGGIGPEQEEAEKRAFGFTHTEVGAVIAMRWNMLELVVRSIRYHHDANGRAARNPGAALTCVCSQAAWIAIRGGSYKLSKEVRELLQLDDRVLDRLSGQAEEILEVIEI